MSATLSSIALVASAAPVAARPASGGEFDQLVGRASRGDETALEELRRIDGVDGRPFDAGTVLRGSTDSERVRRLEVLAEDAGAGGSGSGGAGSSSGASSQARETSRSILDERRFRSSEPPRPFRGVLRRLGDALEPLDQAVRNLFDGLARGLPGGRVTLWVLVAVVVAVVAALAARALIRRRKEEVDKGEPGEGKRRADQRDLAARADDAERHGDHALAVRLRFKAGLISLGAAEVIAYRDSLGSWEVSERLASQTFDQLSISFDEIVYGRRQAGEADSRHSRAGWRKVLEEAAS